jgi:protein-disulfide isomerase
MSDSVGNSEKILINKTTFNAIIIGAVIAIAAAAFASGFVLGESSSGINSDELVKSKLADQIAMLEKKLDDVKVPTPTAQPSQVQPSAPVFIQVSLDDDPVKGNPDAPITIVEFSDFQCPFCARFFDQTLSPLVETYIDTGKVKLVYRDLPLVSIHANAMPTHIAAECADEQGKFWEFHDILFSKQSEWGRLSADDLAYKLNEYATTLKLDISSFESCLTSQEIADEVNKDIFDASTYGASGTPTFFIGNEKDGFVRLAGAQPLESFKGIIDNLG